MRACALLLLVSTTALADDAGILACRAVKDSAARLACYDALPLPTTAASRPASPASAQPAPRPAAPSPGQFGLEHRQEILTIDAIESTIPGRFEGWGPNENIRLANGQVWQVTDGSKGVHWVENPKVRVRRGALGAFYLEIEGTNRSPRVRRLQ